MVYTRKKPSVGWKATEWWCIAGPFTEFYECFGRFSHIWYIFVIACFMHCTPHKRETTYFGQWTNSYVWEISNLFVEPIPNTPIIFIGRSSVGVFLAVLLHDESSVLWIAFDTLVFKLSNFQGRPLRMVFLKIVSTQRYIINAPQFQKYFYR